MPRLLLSYLLGLVGAVLGGVAGFYTFGWFYSHGFYGMMIPGALLGLGCSLLSLHRSVTRGVLCACLALGLSLYTEWSFFSDKSFPDFLATVKNLDSTKLLMIGVGTLIAFWLGKDAGFRMLPRSQVPAGPPAGR